MAAGREAGEREIYIDCFDFCYQGPTEGLKSKLEFKIQHGKGDKVCSSLGNECPKNGGKLCARGVV